MYAYLGTVRVHPFAARSFFFGLADPYGLIRVFVKGAGADRNIGTVADAGEA